MVEKITIVLNVFAGLEKYLDSQTRKGNKVVLPAANNTVKEVIVNQNIPVEKISIIMINGYSAELDASIKNGDTVSLFPPIAGG